MARPIGIDLFAGAGGMSLGFEQAGFDVAAAVEIDPVHAATHDFNFPRCKTIARSVTKLTGKEVRRLAGIGDQPVSVVFGGAPCQGFSMMGQRALDDPRNALVRDFVRLVRELDADYFVFENVKGITVGKHRQFLNEIIEAFEAVGYQVRQPWRVLNAANYHTPQSRERLILLGSKVGLELPEYPEAQCSIAGSSRDTTGLPPGPTCRDALGDLPDAEAYKRLAGDDVVKAKYRKPSAYAAGLRGLVRPEGDFSHPRVWDDGLMTSSMRTEHNDLSRKRFAQTAEGEVEPVSRFFRLPSWGVSNTLRAGTDSARGAFTSPRPIHYQYPRCVTVREMARLHGFPDWFRLHQTKWHGARQIGNAVPPPLARAVAAQVIKAMGVVPSVPKRALALGDASLLTLDMGQAAAHYGIGVPIAQRTRRDVTTSSENASVRLPGA